MFATLCNIPSVIRNVLPFKEVEVPDSPWTMVARFAGDFDVFMHFMTPGAADDKRTELEAKGVTCSNTIYCINPKDMSAFDDFLRK